MQRLVEVIKPVTAACGCTALQSDNIVFTTYGEWSNWDAFNTHLNSDYIKVGGGAPEWAMMSALETDNRH